MADLIDRVAVSIENSVITESEILRQIRLTALLNGEIPDFSPENKRRTAERLVEQILIRREIATTRYMSGSDTGIDEAYTHFRSRFSSDAEYKAALAKASLTDEEVREAFRWQETLLEFIDLRFRPGVQVSDDDIQDYYNAQIAKSPKPVSLEESRPTIERILTEERVNAALDRWLGQARTQTRIRYREEVFR